MVNFFVDIHTPQGLTQEDELEHFKYLSDVITFICTNTDLLFDFYLEAPYCQKNLKEPPISRYNTVKAHTVLNIYGKILKKIDTTNFISIETYPEALCNSVLKVPEESETYSAFLKYVSYAHTNNIPIRIFMGTKNHNVHKPLNFQNSDEDIYSYLQTNNPLCDCSSGLYNCLCKQIYEESPFPYKKVCSELNTAFKKESDSISSCDLNAVIEKYAREMLLRNQYVFDKRLTTINETKTHRLRKIYVQQSDRNINYFASIDFESGGIELFNNRAVHLGQYNFSGEYCKPSEPSTHKLYLKA